MGDGVCGHDLVVFFGEPGIDRLEMGSIMSQSDGAGRVNLLPHPFFGS